GESFISGASSFHLRGQHPRLRAPQRPFSQLPKRPARVFQRRGLPDFVPRKRFATLHVCLHSAQKHQRDR
ncbi:unnamed protein product, partial [Amoebophrya sp. A120]